MNEYQQDIQFGGRLHQIRAYVHDVRISGEDPTSSTFREDVADLLSLLDEYLIEQGIDPSYPERIGRGGDEENN